MDDFCTVAPFSTLYVPKKRLQPAEPYTAVLSEKSNVGNCSGFFTTESAFVMVFNSHSCPVRAT